MKIVALVTALVIFASGCASTYHPREPGRISFVFDGPGLSLYKDGVRYSTGGLSSAPVQAVAGNPLAEEHARKFVSRTRLSWTLYALAIGCLVTSLAVYSQDSGHETRRGIGVGFGLAGVATLIASGVPAVTAFGHLYDAVNIYNDGLAADTRRP